MKYTFWHCGALMGDAHMRKSPTSPRQLFGPFRPTAYGRTLLPKLTGLLPAAAALRNEMVARGISDAAPPAAGVVEKFLDSSPAGHRVMDVGRIIRDIELRDSAGVPVPFHSIGFLDIASLARHFVNHASAAIRQAAPTPSSRVLVSATLASRPTSGIPARRIEIT